MASYWMSPAPERCDLNPSHVIKDGFVDGKTKMGPWANMCAACAKRYGVGLGTGRGQRYERQADGRFMKVEG